MATPAVAVAYPGVGGRREGGDAFVPGFVRKHDAFWDEVVLQKHIFCDELELCLCLEHRTSSREVPKKLDGDPSCYRFQTRDGALTRSQKYQIIIDVPHPPVFRLFARHSTVKTSKEVWVRLPPQFGSSCRE